jgi:hypothetical protein
MQDTTGTRDGATEVRFTHVGLVPAAPCYEFCEPAWQHYITSSLRGMLAGEHSAKQHTA